MSGRGVEEEWRESGGEWRGVEGKEGDLRESFNHRNLLSTGLGQSTPISAYNVQSF